MKIQIGTIAYRNKETNQFENAKPLYINTKSKKLKKRKEQFNDEICEFFINELLNNFSSND